MAITINGGTGVITGISVGGLPDGVVDAGTLATNSVDSAELIDGAVDDSHMAAMAASKLTGALPAISGASLTNLPATLMVSKVLFFGFDIATTGTLAVTGVGFQPTAIIVVGATNSDGMASWCFVDDNGLDKAIYRLDSASVDQFSWEDRFYNLVFGASRRAYADFTSFDSDGFTITRYRQATSAGTVGSMALCLR